MRRLTVATLLMFTAMGCGGGLAPEAFDAAHEPCRYCRMTGSDGRSAAQLVAPDEEPLFFDDLGCLRDYLRQTRAPHGAILYVADHRTREWVQAGGAIYTLDAGIRTPMSSTLTAHASTASRDADPDVRAGVPLTFAEVFGGSLK